MAKCTSCKEADFKVIEWEKVKRKVKGVRKGWSELHETKECPNCGAKSYWKRLI